MEEVHTDSRANRTCAGIGAAAGAAIVGLPRKFTGIGIPGEKVEYCAEGIRREAVQAAAQAGDLNTNQIKEIFNRHTQWILMNGPPAGGKKGELVLIQMQKTLPL